MVRIISASDIERGILPRIQLAGLLHSQGVAFWHVSKASTHTSDASSEAQCPARVALQTPRHVQLFMPARTPGASVVKVVSVASTSANSGIPGVNLLFDEETGQVSHVVNSTVLTALRTAAGSLLSSIVALGKQDVCETVRTLLVFGDGAQALFHVWLHLAYFSAVQRVQVVVGCHRKLTRDEQRQKEFRFKSQLDSLLNSKTSATVTTAAAAAKGFSIDFLNAEEQSDEVRTAVGGASLILMCTPSTWPLFPDSYLDTWSASEQRRHICAVGSYKPHMCELPPQLTTTAARERTLLVDSQSSCAHEAGCLLQALHTPEQIHANTLELGTLLPRPRTASVPADAGAVEWLQQLEQCAHEWKREGKVSVFKSVGVGLQDVEITKLVVALAGNAIGSTVDF